ncbi:type II toxin-antitoxin system RelE/ParE family toxin [Asticcacaulis benevestitus]|uniref:Toxin n=1 Tax=Asticcacaulis benevestitus DSM 16100 = ATCC BAA-896 TaxID=1121022 RepID=V4Q3L3_9CAUL|nr:type II toxin-antitoxin system RelE/ParE family toxin [Asticcacaulis benevestitus]ESQ92445.1 hypothetical protein ABENE_08695 [Asticcacaulis benevestitus DSM 16100 = ATCC BAA-896]
MAAYKLTADAEADFLSLYLYSIETFGLIQANSYALDMIDTFEILAINPFAGRDVKTNARCFIHASHSIYYEIEGEAVLILRILHQSQDPMRHL